MARKHRAAKSSLTTFISYGGSGVLCLIMAGCSTSVGLHGGSGGDAVLSVAEQAAVLRSIGAVDHPDKNGERLAFSGQVFTSADADLSAGSLGIVGPAAPILPEAGFGVGREVSVGGTIDSDYAIANVGAGLPFYRGDDDAAALWVKGYFAADIDDAEDFYAGSIVPTYYTWLDDDTAVMAHVALDLGAQAEEQDLLGQIGVGAAIQWVFDQASTETLMAGVNAYVPFSDYSDTSEYGALDRAPRLGGDVYVEYGRNFDDPGMRVTGTVAGFGFADGDETDSLFGAIATLGIEYWGGLPDGWSIGGFLGPRWANGGDERDSDDSSFDLVGGLKLTYAWGGATKHTETTTYQAETIPGRDCVEIRDGNGDRRFDCSVPVVSGVGGTTKGGEPAREILAPPPDRVEVVETVRRGRRLAEPRRHLGYQSPFAPFSKESREPEPPEEETPGTSVLN
ncbi:MAG: hypothetical protein AAGC62_09115 [Pseudomonadota bacterium]